MSDKYFIEAEDFRTLIIKAYENDDEIWGKSWNLNSRRFDYIDIKHQDGSTFHIKSAFYKLCAIFEHKLECFVVFSEHNRILAFAKDDLEYFKVFKNDHQEIIHEEVEK